MTTEAKTTIIVTIITVTGSVAGAVIANWDKLFGPAPVVSDTDPPVLAASSVAFDLPAPFPALADVSDDEQWGDLGDAYDAGGDRGLAMSAWAIARILDPDDQEWLGHDPDPGAAVAVIEARGITDDEWVGDLGDAAQEQGWTDAAQHLHRLALRLDPTDAEWERKAAHPAPPAVAVVDARSDAPSAVLDAPSDDERWGDLGDAYDAEGAVDLARSAWAVARLLDPGDPEWLGHDPDPSAAGAVIEALGITDDEWVGNLADAAQEQGWPAAAQHLYRLALRLDPADAEWQHKVQVTPTR